MIVAAAVKVGLLVCSVPQPARHHDVLRGINGLYQDGERHFHTYEEETQGFLTDTGVFLNRKQAWEHAHACGQGTPRRDALLKSNPNNYNGQELFSEDLW